MVSTKMGKSRHKKSLVTGTNHINSDPAEYMPIDESYNPSIHRINQAVRTRAVRPDSSVPDTRPILLQFSEPPEDLISKVQGRIDALVEAAEVKKGKKSISNRSSCANQWPVPPKAKGKRRREAVKPISGLDVDALLGEEKKGKISPENAVPDFKHALETADSEEALEDASKQMGNIIRTLVTDSFGDSKYAQALECLGVMREELINMDEPKMFNSFVRDLKMKLLSGTLGGDRREFWFKVRWSKLGLIDNETSEPSDVKPDEVAEVR